MDLKIFIHDGILVIKWNQIKKTKQDTKEVIVTL